MNIWGRAVMPTVKRRTPLLVPRVLLSTAELYRSSQCHSIALPVLLQALALSREFRLQHLASETVLNLAFSQVLGGSGCWPWLPRM